MMWGVNTRPKRQFFMTFFAFFELTFPKPLGLQQDEKKGPPFGDPRVTMSAQCYICAAMSSRWSGLALTYFWVVCRLLCPNACAITMVLTPRSLAITDAAVCLVAWKVKSGSLRPNSRLHNDQR